MISTAWLWFRDKKGTQNWEKWNEIFSHIGWLVYPAIKFCHIWAELAVCQVLSPWWLKIYFHYIIPGNEVVVIFQPLKLVKVQFKRRSTQPIAIWSTQISFWPYLPTYLIMHYGHFCQLSNLTTLLLYNYRLHCSAATCRYHNSQRHWLNSMYI